MSLSGYWIIFFIAFVVTCVSAVLATTNRSKHVYIIVGLTAAVVGFITCVVCLVKINKLTDEEYETMRRMNRHYF